MGRAWELIIISSLFVRRFLISFWEPAGHFHTFGSHLAAKGRLKTNLVVCACFLSFLNNLLGRAVPWSLHLPISMAFAMLPVVLKKVEAPPLLRCHPGIKEAP